LLLNILFPAEKGVCSRNRGKQATRPHNLDYTYTTLQYKRHNDNDDDNVFPSPPQRSRALPDVHLAAADTQYTTYPSTHPPERKKERKDKRKKSFLISDLDMTSKPPRTNYKLSDIRRAV
jgi:hypothetical protein